jgi:hypothetical protein
VLYRPAAAHQSHACCVIMIMYKVRASSRRSNPTYSLIRLGSLSLGCALGFFGEA